jgi:hypothetical protein
MIEYEKTHSLRGADGCKWQEGLNAACPGADIPAVTQRKFMIEMLRDFKLLGPWTHGEELDDAVFRIAAGFPLSDVGDQNYKIEGDEIYGFDPNAFVRRLIEETGISHVWEPIHSKVAPGGFLFTMTTGSEGRTPDLEREARHRARSLLWDLWRRFSGTEELPDGIAGLLFADFLIANLDLVREVETGFRTSHFPPPEVLKTLEQNAQRLW